MLSLEDITGLREPGGHILRVNLPLDSNAKNNPIHNRRMILAISSLSLIMFLTIVFLKSHFATMDSNINSWSASIQSAPVIEMAKIIHYSFAPTPSFAASLLVAVYLFHKKSKDEALLLIGAMAANVALVEIIKIMVHFPRPLNGILTIQGFSFPSGHVVSTVILFGLLTYFAWNHWKSSIPRILWCLFSVVIAIVVGLDRIYLNVHWFSDVLGAYSLGMFLLTFSIVISQYLAKVVNNQDRPTIYRKNK
jgi:undecaprenyl-diphosphatase